MDRPDNYESITTLEILQEELTELPSWISECKKLKELYCNHNKITHLDNLPISLEYLDCGNNPLKYAFKPTLENIRNYINQNNNNNQNNQNKLIK
jgi:Leucine-rich repeat (LRR) protein